MTSQTVFSRCVGSSRNHVLLFSKFWLESGTAKNKQKGNTVLMATVASRWILRRHYSRRSRRHPWANRGFSMLQMEAVHGAVHSVCPRWRQQLDKIGPKSRTTSENSRLAVEWRKQNAQRLRRDCNWRFYGLWYSMRVWFLDCFSSLNLASRLSTPAIHNTKSPP